ncbi:hypothetical protein BXO88_09070 [Oribacterium sp. C9]|uniref:hypothetical protein n=1 Tax=Oribacterium sp. C9 TaxID=1943579 RepID=UPI00098F2389|nr:hypothetical protein [Oribacterium sp. C9]OON86186.1 hypothetical protein BXO88_09070 [Oribacterium sp. C9]
MNEKKLEQYIDNSIINSFFLKKNICIFGIGVLGKRFLSMYKDKLFIKCIYDNGKNNFESYEGIEVKHFELNKHNKEETIIITTDKYSQSIAEQLNENGLYAGKDYFIWDENNNYICDKNTERIILWCKNKWSPKRKNNDKVRLLLPIENSHDITNILYGYVGNYFSEKLDAKIDCYIRAGKPDIFPTIRMIYDAWGADEILTHKLNDKQESICKQICDELWENIHCYEDWINVSIYGIKFGTTIVRNYLRRYNPIIDPQSIQLKNYLLESIRTIVFWYDRFQKFDYRLVVLWDGTNWEGFIRQIAISKGIPTYMIHYVGCKKLTFEEPWLGQQFLYYKKFWNELSPEEKEFGITWSKNELNKILNKKRLNEAKELPKELVEPSNKIKVVICPHSYEDDLYMYGPHIFWNNYSAWLNHLGELSRKLDKYIWFIKPHFFLESERDKQAVSAFLEKFSNIIKLPVNTSPTQLREYGVEWAFTVQGTIGVEYPFEGIQVINAGYNPRMMFDFSFNPKTVAEYDSIVGNLDTTRKKNNNGEIFEYYSIANLYYDWSKLFVKWHYINPLLNMDDIAFIESESNQRVGSWKYDCFLKEEREYPERFVEEFIKKLFDDLDAFKEDFFYKKPISLK